MARSNRLILVGGAVTLLGAALVLAVLFLQRPASSAVDASSADEAPVAEAPAARVVVAQDQAEAITSFEIPEGTSAVAFTVDFQRSVAGLPRSGDRVDVYGRSGDDADGSALDVVLRDVEVLTVTGAAHESNGGSPTAVLAVPEDEVAAALGSHLTDAVYLTLRRDDGDPEGTS